MATTEPIQSGPYPEPSDPPDGPNQMAAIATWAAGRLVMRFASTVARDAVITSPVEGMMAVTGTGASLVAWLYVGTTWVQLASKADLDGATALYTNGRTAPSTHGATTWINALSLTFPADSPAGTYLLDARFTYSGNAASGVLSAKIVDGSAEGSPVIPETTQSLNAQSGVSTPASAHTKYVHAGGTHTIALWVHCTSAMALGVASIRAAYFGRA